MKNGKILNILLLSVIAVLISAIGYLAYVGIEKKSKLKSEQNEIAVQMLSFDELPKNEQDKYVKKDNLDNYGKFLTPKSYERNFNIDSVNEPIPDDIDELKRQVGDLRVQNRLLYDDNVDLVSKNLEIANLLSERQDNQSSQKLNLRMIVDHQKQLDTINELTKKLEEAQRDSLQSSKISSQKIIELQNENDSLKSEILKKQSEFEKDKTDLLAKNSNELSKNLKIKVDENQKLEKNLLKIQDELVKLKDENSRLIDNLSLKESEIKRVSTEQKDQISKIKTAAEDELSALKKEFNTKDSEYKKSLKSKQDELDSIKKERSTVESDLNIKIKELEKKLKEANLTNEKNSKLQSINLEQNATIEQLKSRLLKEREGFNKDVTQMWSLHKNEIEKLKKELEDVAISMQTTKGELESKLDELTVLNSQKDELLSQQESNITALNSMLGSQTQRLESEISANKKNIQNYKILNDKITSLIQSNAIINKEAKKRIDNAEGAAQRYKQLVEELNSTVIKKDSEIKDMIVQIDRLKISADEQNRKNEAQNEKLKADKTNPSASEISELKRRISELMYDGEYLANENENLKKIIQLNFKTEVPKKVVFISSIECNDMSIGSDKPTVMCKNRVSEFLQQYNSNYYFEITPIVSQGNFIATSKAAQAIPKDELEKINSYANFGIGRERAKTAGELVRDEFGDFSRISYSNDIITSSNKQGFVIKVYR